MKNRPELFADCCKVRQKLTDQTIELKPALLDQLHRAGRRDCFGHRGAVGSHVIRLGRRAGKPNPVYDSMLDWLSVPHVILHSFR